jgi:hypothetical protein
MCSYRLSARTQTLQESSEHLGTRTVVHERRWRGVHVEVPRRRRNRSLARAPPPPARRARRRPRPATPAAGPARRPCGTRSRGRGCVLQDRRPCHGAASTIGNHAAVTSHTTHAIRSTTACSGDSTQDRSRWPTARVIHPQCQQYRDDRDRGDGNRAGESERRGEPVHAPLVPQCACSLRPLLPVDQTLDVAGQLGLAHHPLVSRLAVRLPHAAHQHPEAGRHVDDPVADRPPRSGAGPLVRL